MSDLCPDCGTKMVPVVIDQPGVSGSLSDRLKCENKTCISRAANRGVHVAADELADLITIHVGMTAKLNGDHFKDPETGGDFLDGLWALENRLKRVLELIRQANRR